MFKLVAATLTSTSVNCSVGREVMAAMFRTNSALLLILPQSLTFFIFKVYIDIYNTMTVKTLPILISTHTLTPIPGDPLLSVHINN